MTKATVHRRTETLANEKTQAIHGLQQTGAAVVGISSLLLGCWAIACMTAGLIVSGGPLNLATSYVKGLIG